MKVDTETIERMVREVLNSIQSDASSRSLLPPGDSVKTKTKDLSTTEKETKDNSSVLDRVWISSKVVTAEVVRSARRGKLTIVVGSKAIVTPSAVDYLRAEKLDWVRGGEASATNQDTRTTWKILVSTAGESGIVAARAVRQDEPRVSIDVIGNARELTRLATTALSRAEVPGIIALTEAPEYVTCLANRQDVVRAVVVRDLADWGKIQSRMRPNLVCLDPSNRMFMELKNLMSKIVRDPLPVTPAGWGE